MVEPLRILFAALALPYPPMNGHHLRTWAMVRALAAQGHTISVTSFAEPHEVSADLTPLRALCRSVDLVPLPGRRPPAREALDRLRALVSPLPYGAWRLRSAHYVRAIERALASDHFDLLICDGIYNAQNLPTASPVPVVLNKDDVAYMILRRYLAFERNAARRLYGALEARKVLRWERSVCRRMAAVLACSAHDRGLLQPLCPSVPVSVVPNVVDTAAYSPRGGAEPLTVLFQGGMDWYPNRDAVELFASAILPELRLLVSSVTFRVAGRAAIDHFEKRFDASSGIQFTGTVPDMRDEVAKASVCVVPLRIGSGTRLKILEAAAMAKPIVSTHVGAEGLDFVDGSEILLVDEPRAYALTVARLLRNPAERDLLGMAARRRVENSYSLSVLGTALSTALAGARL